MTAGYNMSLHAHVKDQCMDSFRQTCPEKRIRKEDANNLDEKIQMQ